MRVLIRLAVPKSLIFLKLESQKSCTTINNLECVPTGKSMSKKYSSKYLKVCIFLLFYSTFSGVLNAASVNVVSFEANPFTARERGNTQALHITFCRKGISVDDTSISGRQCIRLKGDRRAGRGWNYHLIIENNGFTIFPFKTKNKEGNNHKFWLREQQADDTENFYRFLKNAPADGVAVL